MKIYKLLYLPLLVLLCACQSDDNGSGEPMDFGESSLSLSGDYELDLEGRAIFTISEQAMQGSHQFKINLDGNQEKRYGMNLIIRLEDTNYQVLEGTSFPLSNVVLSNNAEAFSTDLVLYGDSLTDVIAEWTSIEDDGNGVGAISITKADDEIVEGTIEASLTPKSGEASEQLIISNATFRAVRNQ